MGNVLSSSPATFFDVKNESQLLSLLKMVRHSTLDSESKDDIRDIVFEIQEANFDPLLLEELSLYLQPLNATVLRNTHTDTKPKTDEGEEKEIVKEFTPAPISNLQTTNKKYVRPVPAFGNNANNQSNNANKVKLNIQNEEPANIEPAAVVIDKVGAEPVPAAVAKNAVPVNEVASEPVKSEPTAKPEVGDLSVEKAQARITEIKRTVNAAVGNPINLIDADNTKGREYMNALLDAMRAVSAGGADLGTVMTRLESAYNNIEALLQKPVGEVGTQTPTSTPVPNPTPTPVSIPTPSPEPIQTSDPAVETSSAVTTEPTNSENEPNAWTPPPAEVEPEIPKAPVEQVENANDTKLKAVSETDVVQKPVEKQIENTAAVDPLMTEQINNGLQQLLNEWKLFKSSGIFGTGPNGQDHPLYKEVRNLPMNLIITGRFEGATPEIKQSITDYMNGWRYEQGMIHDMQETFEHYLRRVIKAIIDKRKIAS